MHRILIKLTIFIAFIATMIVVIANFNKLNQAQKSYENLSSSRPSKSSYINDLPINVTMNIISPAFLNNSTIPPQYTCDGDNINPPLKFSDIPANTQSLTIIVDDPDAPSGDWVHWLVWNIDPQIDQITAGSVPQKGIQGKNDFGDNSYGGPCPPSGEHHYQFKLYALDAILDLASDTTKNQLLESMQDHIISQATLIGLYSRQ